MNVLFEWMAIHTLIRIVLLYYNYYYLIMWEFLSRDLKEELDWFWKWVTSRALSKCWWCVWPIVCRKGLLKTWHPFRSTLTFLNVWWCIYFTVNLKLIHYLRNQVIWIQHTVKWMLWTWVSPWGDLTQTAIRRPVLKCLLANVVIMCTKCLQYLVILIQQTADLELVKRVSSWPWDQFPKCLFGLDFIMSV
jgi:hypothetical protein